MYKRTKENKKITPVECLVTLTINFDKATECNGKGKSNYWKQIALFTTKSTENATARVW